MTLPNPEIAFYTNLNGQLVTHGSYSARSTFKKCPREFELVRIQGWGQKEERAAPLFGKCIEAAVEYHEGRERKPGTCVAKFAELWEQVKTVPRFENLTYTGAEGDYAQLTGAGIDLCKLYEIKAPYLPISTHPKALFQQTWRKEIFPGTAYAGLENKAIIDLLSFPRWDHSALPKGALYATNHGCHECAVRWSCALEADGPAFVPCKEHQVLPIIIDIKTAGSDLDAHLVALDPQLGEYAWQGRIPLVAFLWFVKKSPELKKGARVTLLQDVGSYRAGFELITLLYKSKEGVLYLGTADLFDEYEKATRDLSGKAQDAAKNAFVAQPSVVSCTASAVTKQRLQFASACLTEEELNDIGRSVAQTTVEQVRAHNEKFYPKLPGIRFPNQKCNFCSMRYICLNDGAGRDANLTRKGEEWLEGVDEGE